MPSKNSRLHPCLNKRLATNLKLSLSGKIYTYSMLSEYLGMSRVAVKKRVETYTTKEQRMSSKIKDVPIDVFNFFFWTASENYSQLTWVGKRPTYGNIYLINGKPYSTKEAINGLHIASWKLHERYCHLKVA